MSRISLKRVYEPPDPADGTRVLVERLWPRGVSKEDAALDLWVKEVAPSTELRKWYGHDPSRWEEFERRYRAELEERPDAVARLVALAREGPLTLVLAKRDVERSSAALLLRYLEDALDAWPKPRPHESPARPGPTARRGVRRPPGSAKRDEERGNVHPD